MATEVVHSIRPSGGDYTTLETWRDDQARDLVAVDEIAVAEIYDEFGSKGLTVQNFSLTDGNGSAWNTSDINRILVRAASGHEWDPSTNTGVTLYTEATGTITYNIAIPNKYLNATFTRLIIRSIALGTTKRSQSLQQRSGSVNCNLVFASCYFDGNVNDSLFADSTFSPWKVSFSLRSCVVKNRESSNIGRFFRVDGTGGVIDIVNCLFISGVQFCEAVNGAASNLKIRNSCCFNQSNRGWTPGTYHADCSNNASWDASVNAPPGSNPLLTDVTASDFADAANGDYHLSSSSILWGQGANLSADYPNMLDMDGNPFPQTGAWSIGAHYPLASEIVHSIRPSGGDYTTLETWRDDQARDLIAINEIAVAEVYDEFGLDGLIIQNFSITAGAGTSWVTSAVNRIVVRAAVGNDKAIISNAGGTAYTHIFDEAATECYISYENLHFIVKTSNGLFLRSNNQDLNIELYRNYIESNAQVHLINGQVGFKGHLTIKSSLLKGTSNVWTLVRNDEWTGYITCINTAFVGAGQLNSSGGTNGWAKQIFKNCYGYAQTNQSWAAGETLNSECTNNASWDAESNTPPGSNPLLSNLVDSDFVDPANGDYHLSSISNLRNVGINLSAEYQDLEDFDGNLFPKTGAWDIGAHYYIEAAGIIIPHNVQCGQESQNITLNLSYRVIPNNVEASQQTDNLILSESSTLNIDSVEMQQNTDNLTLSQWNQLLLNNTETRQDTQHLRLVGTGFIALENTTSYTTSENIVIVPLFTIIPDNTENSTESDNLTLSSAGSIVLYSTESNQESDSLALTPRFIIKVDSSENRVETDNIILSDYLPLVLQDTINYTTSSKLTLAIKFLVVPDESKNSVETKHLQLNAWNLISVDDISLSQQTANLRLIPAGSILLQNTTQWWLDNDLILTPHFSLLLNDTVIAQNTDNLKLSDIKFIINLKGTEQDVETDGLKLIPEGNILLDNTTLYQLTNSLFLWIALVDENFNPIYVLKPIKSFHIADKDTNVFVDGIVKDFHIN